MVRNDKRELETPKGQNAKTGKSQKVKKSKSRESNTAESVIRNPQSPIPNPQSSIVNRQSSIGRLIGVLLCFAAVLLLMHEASARPIEEDQQAASPDPHAPSAGLSFAPKPDDEPADREDDADEDTPAPTTGLRKLTTEEVNRIRFMELRAMRILDSDKPDRVKAKIPKRVIDDYLLARAEDYLAEKRADDPGFPGPSEKQKEKWRRDFRKLTVAQKLHWIARHTGTRYADRVSIRSDPEVFVTFKKNVMPVVLRHCGKSGCHDSGSQDDAPGFRLFNDPKKSPLTTYANFIMLNDTEVDHQQMIDRGRPESSLILTYMLPPKEVKAELRHPPGIKFKPPFRARKAPDCRRIEKWLRSLKHPAEDYGVRLVPKSEDLLPEEEEDDDEG